MNNGALPYTRKDLKRTAREMLAKKAVVFKLIFAVFICVVIRMGMELAASVVYMALYSVIPGAELVIAFALPPTFRIMTVFVMAPAVFGTYRLASMLAQGMPADMSEMFYYFYPKKYARALGGYIAAAWPIEIFVILFDALLTWVSILLYGMSANELLIVQIGMTVFVFAAAIPLLVPYFRLFSIPAAIVNGEGQPLGVCIRAAKRATRKRVREIFAFFFSFVPMILLSLLTVGMLLIAFTLPYMLLSYFYYNAVLFGKDPMPEIYEEVTFDER